MCRYAAIPTEGSQGCNHCREKVLAAPRVPWLRLRVRRRLLVSCWAVVAVFGIRLLAFGFEPFASALRPSASRFKSLTLRFGASAVGLWQLAFSPVCICAVWALASSYVFGFFCWVGVGVGFVFVFGSCFNFAFGHGLRPLVFVRWPLGCFVLSPSRSGLRL